MRIAVCAGKFIMGSRPPIDIDNIWNDPRGATGTEVAFIYLAQCLTRLGHNVTVFSKIKQPGIVDGVSWAHFDSIRTILDHDGSFDVAISMCESDPFRDFPRLGRKNIVWQEVNDTSYADSNGFQFVDKWVGISTNHMQHMTEVEPRIPAEKWTFIHNPVDMDLYQETPKVPNRVIYCSSPDRGLHRLLEIWPQVIKQEPKATLRIFYDIQGWLHRMLSIDHKHHILKRLKQRAIYINHVLPILLKWGVSVHQAVSRNQIVKEMSEASVFGYTCDPILYTEGFSCATLEACAAGTWPVITDADALPSLYGSVATVVPREKIRSDFASAIVTALHKTDSREGLRKFAKQFDLRCMSDAWNKLLLELQ